MARRDNPRSEVATHSGGDALDGIGYSAEERQRLSNQGALLRPFTRQPMVEANIGHGMRVLDLGCGARASRNQGVA